MWSFPSYIQHDSMDCGPTCLQMIVAYYGKKQSLAYLRTLCDADKAGVSLYGLRQAAQALDFDTKTTHLPFIAEQENILSLQNIPLPCVIHWEQNHFVVLYKCTTRYAWVADPKLGKRKLTRAEFEESWRGQNPNGTGIALLLEPNDAFYQKEKASTLNAQGRGFGFLLPYIRPYRRLLVQLCVGLAMGSLFQLVFPFLTQAVVDIGIQNQDIGFIYLILVAQLMLFFGKTVVNVLQSWILLYVGSHINIQLIADFLKKLLFLPMSFFETRHIGDLLQRIDDHHRIETFLTSAALRSLFSIIHILIFAIVLLFYNTAIFIVFVVSSILFLIWVFLFLNKRKQIDYQQFEQMAAHQNKLLEIIEGAATIKIQGTETQHRWAWASVQAQLFRTSMRALEVTQYQDHGAQFINQLKDIIITFIAAKAVINGSMTLGMLLAVQFIVGQLSSPLYQLVQFVRLAQDAQLSLERLNDIHQHPNEVTPHDILIEQLPAKPNIEMVDVAFRYNQSGAWALENINLTIPFGKTTAIVGHSGSGKTTLLKLLLGFYNTTKGQIKIGPVHLRHLNKSTWRQKCGVVMQNSYVFSDTILHNITGHAETVDYDRLYYTLKAANLQFFIDQLPLGIQTKLGTKGNTISQGQRQRLLIARAIYHNPDFVFFDEATNALDAENERTIIENLNDFFSQKTVVVVAHRLSTVRHADQIVVLQQGRIVEIGTHDELICQKGTYFALVKNQLEL